SQRRCTSTHSRLWTVPELDGRDSAAALWKALRRGPDGSLAQDRFPVLAAQRQRTNLQDRGFPGSAAENCPRLAFVGVVLASARPVASRSACGVRAADARLSARRWCVLLPAARAATQ